MSLTFGGATTDRVVVATNAALTTQSAITVAGWFYPTTLTSLRILVWKNRNATGQSWQLQWNGTAGDLQSFMAMTTTNQSYITNDAPCATLNKWYFVAATIDATVASHIYVGDLDSPAVESTYGTAQVGAGSLSADSGGTLVIGNRATGHDRAFEGRIGPVTVLPRVLSLGEILSLQHDMRKLTGAAHLFRLGESGTGTQPDYAGSGLGGTVTGATRSEPPPLRRWRRGLVMPPLYTVNAAKRPPWLF